MSSSDHINGENQSLEQYLLVLSCRASGFQQWVNTHRLAAGVRADECDWDDAYVWWFENIETSMTPSSKSFSEYLEGLDDD